MKNLFLLDPDIVFLNHGSFGACPRPVFEEYQRLQRELERQPVEFLALERRFAPMLDEARRALASHVGADPACLAFATNTSAALNAAIRSLPLGPGDEVLLGDAEYGGMLILWEHVARRTGARLVHRPFDALEPGPRTRVVFCSHVEWTTGRVNELAPVVAAAREAGAISVVDGAHAPGQVDVDLEAIGPDVYAANAHKWLCAPKGSAFLYARPGVQDLIEPAVLSWDFVEGATFPERHRWQGTRDPAAHLAVPAAIRFQAEHDWPSVRARCHELLAGLDLGLEPLTGTYAQMRGFRLEHPDPAALKERLWREHRIEVPVLETPHGWILRVSVQAYNDQSDLDALAGALSSIDSSPSRSS